MTRDLLMLPGNHPAFPWSIDSSTSPGNHLILFKPSNLFTLQTSMHLSPSSSPTDDLASYFTEKIKAIRKGPQKTSLSLNVGGWVCVCVCASAPTVSALLSVAVDELPKADLLPAQGHCLRNCLSLT